MWYCFKLSVCQHNLRMCWQTVYARKSGLATSETPCDIKRSIAAPAPPLTWIELNFCPPWKTNSTLQSSQKPTAGFLYCICLDFFYRFYFFKSFEAVLVPRRRKCSSFAFLRGLFTYLPTIPPPLNCELMEGSRSRFRKEKKNSTVWMLSYFLHAFAHLNWKRGNSWTAALVRWWGLFADKG